MSFVQKSVLCYMFASIAILVHTSGQRFEFLKHMTFKKKLMDQLALASIPGISFEQCYKECNARIKCHSMSYRTNANHCYLGTTGLSNLGLLVEGSGYVYADRASWNKTQPAGCANCSENETCLQSGGSGHCQAKECGPAVLLKPNATQSGNMMTVGAIVKYECTFNPCAVKFSTCLGDGKWSDAQAPVCKYDLPVLEGKRFHITNVRLQKWWHSDISISPRGLITTWWAQRPQSDKQTEFSLVRVGPEHNRFIIRINTTLDFVTQNGNTFFAKPIPEVTADRFTVLPSCNAFRLLHDKSQRFVYVTDNLQVTTAGVATYERSLFKFEAV